jgi:hypothetical protein
MDFLSLPMFVFSSHSRNSLSECSMSVSKLVEDLRDKPIENVPRAALLLLALNAAPVLRPVLAGLVFGSGKLVRDRDNMIRFGVAPVSEAGDSSGLGRFGFGVRPEPVT